MSVLNSQAGMSQRWKTTPPYEGNNGKSERDAAARFEEYERTAMVFLIAIISIIPSRPLFCVFCLLTCSHGSHCGELMSLLIIRIP